MTINSSSDGIKHDDDDNINGDIHGTMMTMIGTAHNQKGYTPMLLQSYSF